MSSRKMGPSLSVTVMMRTFFHTSVAIFRKCLANFDQFCGLLHDLLEAQDREQEKSLI